MSNIFLKLASTPVNPVSVNRQFFHYVLTIWLTAFAVSFTTHQARAAQTLTQCQLSPEAIAEKKMLREAAQAGDRDATGGYNHLLTEHAQAIARCRQQSWLKNQGIWLRLYPCDAKSGSIEKILDNLVNKGYNQVYLEVFYDGQVLLPSAQNPTPWLSVLRTPGTQNIDLLAQTIEKGRQRGLKVYSWMFMLNFGYTYTLKSERQQVLARNGAGNTTVTNFSNDTVESDHFGESYINQGFVDPYNPTGQQDYLRLVNTVLQRQPDGILFDYVRYPKGLGAASVASKVKDLWIYGDASIQAFLQRGKTEQSQALIRRFLEQGYTNETDTDLINGIVSNPQTWTTLEAIPSMGNSLQQQLWRLSVAHAQQGILDFLAIATQPVQQQGLPVGAVFFPEGNRRVRQQGFDSRLQPWPLFPTNLQWHPMAYGICGNTDCIVSQVQEVVRQAPPGTQIIPALAGDWGQRLKNRPPLEAQMEAIHRAVPQIHSISHYSYGWQEPEATRERKFCQL